MSLRFVRACEMLAAYLTTSTMDHRSVGTSVSAPAMFQGSCLKPIFPRNFEIAARAACATRDSASVRIW